MHLLTQISYNKTPLVGKYYIECEKSHCTVLHYISKYYTSMFCKSYLIVTKITLIRS